MVLQLSVKVQIDICERKLIWLHTYEVSSKFTILHLYTIRPWGCLLPHYTFRLSIFNPYKISMTYLWKFPDSTSPIKIPRLRRAYFCATTSGSICWGFLSFLIIERIVRSTSRVLMENTCGEKGLFYTTTERGMDHWLSLVEPSLSVQLVRSPHWPVGTEGYS